MILIPSNKTIQSEKIFVYKIPDDREISIQNNLMYVCMADTSSDNPYNLLKVGLYKSKI